MKAELAQAYQEIALLKEEMSIKDERFQRIPPHRRPHYSPIQRLRILKLKAARKWSLAQTANAFNLTELTQISWNRRLDEEVQLCLSFLSNLTPDRLDFIHRIVNELSICLKISRLNAQNLAGLVYGLPKCSKFANRLARGAIFQKANFFTPRLVQDQPKTECRIVNVWIITITPCATECAVIICVPRTSTMHPQSTFC